MKILFEGVTSKVWPLILPNLVKEFVSVRSIVVVVN